MSTPDIPGVIWGDWHGDFATAAAAKRYVTVNWTGPRVPDRESWVGFDIRATPEGRWQVRLAQAAFTSSLFSSQETA